MFNGIERGEEKEGRYQKIEEMYIYIYIFRFRWNKLV